MIDWQDPLLKRYLLVPLVLVIAITGVYFAADYFLEEQRFQLDRDEKYKESQVNNIMRQVRFLRYQERLFLTYGDKYQELIRDGLIHKQDRVKWTDELLKIQRKLALTPFTIRFEPEQKLKQADLARMKLEKDIFYYTRLNLSVGLQSDLDIIALFDQVTQNITPLYLVDKCDLAVNLVDIEKPSFNPDKGAIRMACSLILFEAKPNPFKAVE